MSTVTNTKHRRQVTMKNQWRFGVGIVAMWLVLGSSSMVYAQTETPETGTPSTDTAPAADTEKLPLIDRLIRDGIPGVEADMTVDDLIDLAVEFQQTRQLDVAKTLIVNIVHDNPRNLRAVQTAARIFELISLDAKSEPMSNESRAKAQDYMALAIKVWLEEAIPLAIELNQRQMAGEMYRAVLSHEPNNAKAQLGFARLLAEMGQTLYAIEWYRSYINPRNNFGGHQDSQAHLELARLYRSRRSLNLAITTLQKAERLNPQNEEILVELAYCYLERANAGDPDKAVEVAKNAATLKAPENPLCRLVYAEILLKLANMPQVGPGSVDRAKEQLSEAEVQSKEAIRLAKTISDNNPDDLSMLAMLGRGYSVYMSVLQRKLQAQTASSGATIRVELARTRQAQANVTRVMNLHAALGEILAAGDSLAGSVPAQELRAQLELAVGKYAAAAETCRRLEALQPGNKVAAEIFSQLPEKVRSTTTAPADSGA